MRISDFCRTAAGGTPLKSNKTFYEGGTIPWLLSGEVSKRDITEATHFITLAGLNGSSAKIFPVNTVLVAMYGATAGEVGILRFEAATNQAVCGIYPNAKVIPEYLYYFFLCYKHQLVAQAVGNAQPNISQQKIKDTEIELPSVPEQKRIVAILDQVFADIDRAHELTEKNLNNARELFESYLHQVFSRRGEGWEQHALGDICSLISGQHIDAKDYNNEGRGVGYLTGPSDFGELNPIVSKWTEKPKRLARTGDILITVKGSGVGKVNIMDRDQLAISRQLMAVRTEDASVDLVYWFLLLQYSYFQSLANGAAIPGISREDVLSLKLSLPTSKSRQALADEITAVKGETNKLIDILTNKVANLEELKKSLLQKAFTGELTEAGAAEHTEAVA